MEESVFSQSPFSSESPSTSSSSSSSGRSGRGKKLLFLIILLIILGLIAFGAVKFLGGSGTPAPTPAPTMAEPTPTDTPTPTPEETGTPTPSPKSTTPTPTKKAGSSIDSATGIDRATITVNVQNGSGVAGAAKTGGDTLSSLGYTLGTVGNADNSDYAQTEVHVKAGKGSLLTLLKKDLSSDYTVGTAVADYTGSGDALVIIGKQ